MKKTKTAATGVLAGFLNGIFGSGGGVAAVPLFRKNGLDQKEAQATSLLLMFLLSAVSAGIYLSEGRISVPDAVPYIPGGILGGIAASVLFRKMKPDLLRKIFGGFVTFSAARMLWGVVSEWIF
ncbi:MAG: sulfite exporter TauE/SafE family protein [Oscillospiraceae bacterium]|nr:sulfite exporter TauE/SafE family protein [Oscillospiraceae bacterium]MBQ4643137.1 sulfite exporter TauE/SafE family protein [Oscillospiraceae bacterium]